MSEGRRLSETPPIHHPPMRHRKVHAVRNSRVLRHGAPTWGVCQQCRARAADGPIVIRSGLHPLQRQGGRAHVSLQPRRHTPPAALSSVVDGSACKGNSRNGRGAQGSGQRGANWLPVPGGVEPVSDRKCARYKAEGKFVFYAEISARLPKVLKDDPRLAKLPHGAAL